MNWLDIVMLCFIGTGALIGLKIRVTGAVFTVMGLALGVYLSMRFNSDISRILLDFIDNDGVARLIAYGILFLVVLAVSMTIGRMVRKMMKMFLMSWIDILGGLGLGIIGGIIISGGIVFGLARYSYSSEISSNSSNNEMVVISQKLGLSAKTKETLINSSIVPIFFYIRDTLPKDGRDLIPQDFMKAMDYLEVDVDSD